MNLDDPVAILSALVAEPEPVDSESGNFALCCHQPPWHEADCVWLRAWLWIEQLKAATTR